MPISIRIFALIVIIIYFAVIITLLRKKRLELKYSLLWLFGGAVMLLLVIFPAILINITALMGIEVPSNGLFAACIFLIIIILISITTVISAFSNKIKRLNQEIAILKKKVSDLEDSK